MTATQVFKRFLKDNGLYASYMPRLRKAYKGAVNSSLKYNGKDYFEKVIYQPLLIDERKENEIMLDVILKVISYRFIDALWAISVYTNTQYNQNAEVSKKLYKFSMKYLKRYQLTAFSHTRKKQLDFEWK